MALLTSKNVIERAIFVVLALFQHMKRRYLLREAVDIRLSVAVIVVLLGEQCASNSKKR